MEDSPADKDIPKNKKKPGGSKSGTMSPRSPKASKKQVESPSPRNQKGKRSVSRRLDRPSSPKQQEGKVNQPALKAASPEHIPGVTEIPAMAPASHLATNAQAAITLSQRQSSQDHETEDSKAPAQALRATLVPTSIDSLATVTSDLPSSEGKKMDSGKCDPGGPDSKQDQHLSVVRNEPEGTAERSGNKAPVTTSYGGSPVVACEVPAILAASQPDSDNAMEVVQPEVLAPTPPEKKAEFPDARDQKHKSGRMREQRTTTDQRYVETQGAISSQEALQDAVGEIPSPNAADALIAIDDQGEASTSLNAENKRGFVYPLQDPLSNWKEMESTKSPARDFQPLYPTSSVGSMIDVRVNPSKKALDGSTSPKEPFPPVQVSETVNTAVPNEKQTLRAASQTGFTVSANAPNTLATGQTTGGRIIGQFKTRVPTASTPTATAERKKLGTARWGTTNSDPNAQRMSPEAKTLASLARRRSMAKTMDSPRLGNTSTKRFSTKVCASLIVITLAFVSLLAFFLSRHETRVLKEKTCSTQACEEYSKILLASINNSVNPCDSFTHYVCDGWRQNHKLSVNHETLEAALDRLHSAITALDVPDGAQGSFERAAVFYQSCDCVRTGKCDQLPNVVAALEEAGIVWPRKPSSPDVLRTILFTSLKLGWDAVISFGITSRGSNKRIRLRTADEFHFLIQKREEQLGSSAKQRKRYFEVLKDLFVATASNSTENEGLVSYEETHQVEQQILEDLESSAYLTPLGTVDDSLLYRLMPNMTSERFKDTLRECGVPLDPSDTITFATNAYSFIYKFIWHWSRQGEEAMHFSISWWTVQLAALFSNQDLLVNFYGSQTQTEIMHDMFCLSKTFVITGNEVLYGYSEYFLPANLRPAAEELVLNVRDAFHQRVLRWGSYDENATVVHDWNSTAVALTYFYQSLRQNFTDQVRTTVERDAGAEKNIDPHKSKVTFKDDSLVANWLLAVQDLLDDPASFLLPEVIQNRDQYLLRNTGEGSPDLVLMPYAFTFPYFDQASTRAFNYAGVGTRVAEALTQLFIDAYFFSEISSDIVQGFITCMQDSAHDKLSLRNYARHVEPVSLSTVLEAYRANGEALLRDHPAVGLEWLTQEQVLFVSACFTRCMGSEDTGPAAQLQCDDTFKHVPEFATAFRCKPGAPMNPDSRCKLL